MLLGNMNVTWLYTSVFLEIFVLFILKPVKILGNSLICSGLVFQNLFIKTRAAFNLGLIFLYY